MLMPKGIRDFRASLTEDQKKVYEAMCEEGSLLTTAEEKKEFNARWLSAGFPYGEQKAI